MQRMKSFRNIIMLTLLGLFFAWYAATWAYESLYNEPRQRLGRELTKLKQEIETGKQNFALMSQGFEQNKAYYYRSLPRVPNDAKSQYSFWLLELLKYCGIDNANVDGNNPSRIAFGADYRFNVRGTCSFEQLSRLMFEFYYAPFLHRITAMTITPVEGKAGTMTISLTIDALALQPRSPNDPYPLLNQIPTGWYVPRLMSNDLNTYGIIAERNLLQTAKGGVDKADYTFLTAINQIDGQPEIWLTIRTDNSIVKAKQGEPIHIGSFSGTVMEILEQDAVLERSGTRWLITLGDCLNQAFALPPEGQ
jgi:hypothetical protein